jgi:predicted dienelactone hydrolase
MRIGLFLLALAAAAGWLSVSRSAATRPAFTVRTVRLVDHSRTAHFADGTSSPRVLVTYVRVPTHRHAPYPLVVFAHGFALSPAVYGPLLDTWARAGYLVAAPVFPVENANAPGGPSERDLVNQPADLGFVVSRLTATTGPLRGLVDRSRIALAGQSDGAETALAAAYDRRYLVRNIRAALILSGAALPGFTGPPAGAPPLLAVREPMTP